MVRDSEIAKARGRTIMSLMSQDKVLKKSGSGYVTLCSFHNETTPSMSLFKGQDGCWRYFCHGCGASGDTVKYIQMAKGMPFTDAVNYLCDEAKTAPIKPVQVATYSYENESGECLYQVLRYSPKSFRQRQTGPNGWVWCMAGVRRVLYRLPKLLASTETIIYCEGERDVETMEANGYLATTHAGGAGAWRKELLSCLPDKRKIVVVPDLDEPGKQLMRRVFSDARTAGHEVGFAILPSELNGKPVKDVTDFFEACGTKEMLEGLIK